MKWLIRKTMQDLYPASGELPGIEDTGLDTYLDKFKAEAPALMYTGLVAGSALYQLTPMLTVGKPLPAVLLSPELREQHAQKITSTSNYPLRQSIFLVKMVAGMCWGKDERVRRKMNMDAYEGDPGTWRSE